MELSSGSQPPWHKARHIEGISIRNLSLIPEPSKSTMRDGYLKPGGPLSPLRHTGPKLELERSQSAIDLKSAANEATLQVESNGSAKRPSPRLRRRSTLSGLNESGSARQSRLLEVTKRIPSAFFSIHAPYIDGRLRETPKDHGSLYVSETVWQSMNPDFKFVDPGRLTGSVLGVLARFVLRVWTQAANEREHDVFFLLLELDVNLSGLKWIGSSLDHYPRSFPPNTVIFKLHDGFYTDGADLPNSSREDTRTPLSRSVTSLPSTTSSFHELMKLNNVNEVIDDALRTRTRVMQDIERLLAADEPRTASLLAAANAPLTTREPLDAVSDTRRQVKKLRAAIGTARATLDRRRAAIAHGTAGITSSQSSLTGDRDAVSGLEGHHTALKPQLAGQIRRLANTLLDILPIVPIPGAPLHFTIGGLYLPSAAAFSRSTSPASSSSSATIPPVDEAATAAALGHVALLVHTLAGYLAVALPFALFPHSSTSAVFDPLTSAAQLGIPEKTPRGPPPRGPFQSSPNADTDPDNDNTLYPPTPATAPSRLFPLTQRGTPGPRFAWAVYLVNKDLEELMGAVGLKVVDPRATVANLKYLLEVLAAEQRGVGVGRREGGLVRGLRGEEGDDYGEG